MTIQERFTQMQALQDEMKDLLKHQGDLDELTNGDKSTLEDMEGLMETIGTTASQISLMSQAVSVLVSDDYSKVRGYSEPKKMAVVAEAIQYASN